MFRLQLILIKRSDEILELKLPLSFRITFGIISGILLANMASLSSFGAVPIVVTAITAIAALYEERWTFDREKKIVVHKYGLLFLAHTKTVEFSEIDRMILSNFREKKEDGGMPTRRTVALRSLVSFHILTRSDRHLTVEIRNNRHNQSLKENAEHLAEFCEIELEHVN